MRTLKKIEADLIPAIDVSFLKRHGFFKDEGLRATFTWTYVWAFRQEILTATLYSEINQTGGNLYISYSLGERLMEYSVPLIKTPCRYGGSRFWFKCENDGGGEYCSRRVGKLYLLGEYFTCRHCNDLTYQSKNARD